MLEDEKRPLERCRAAKCENVRVGMEEVEKGPENKRGSVLLCALDVINGERQQRYGNPEDSFEDIAWAWNWWLDGENAPITAADVAMMMALMKIAREKNGAGKTDNIVDCCGYLGLYEDMRGIEE